MAQQTAVEYLFKQYELTGDISNSQWDKARRMEKEQIINACIHTASKLSDVGLSDITINGEIELAEQYYNQTYKQNT